MTTLTVDQARAADRVRVVDRVRDVMSTPVTALRDYDSAWRALERFADTGLRHLVVLDADDQLVGVLDDRQVLSRWPLDAVSMHRQTVGELVRSLRSSSHLPPRVHHRETVTRAAAVMLQFSVDGLPVVDGTGAVVGIVTGSDLVRSMVRAAAASEQVGQDAGTRQTATVPPSGPA